jgi:hypothetical protein
MGLVIGLVRVVGKNRDSQGVEDNSRVSWMAGKEGRGKAKDLRSVFISEPKIGSAGMVTGSKTWRGCWDASGKEDNESERTTSHALFPGGVGLATLQLDHGNTKGWLTEPSIMELKG